MSIDSSLVEFYPKSAYKDIRLSTDEDFFRTYDADRNRYWSDNGNEDNLVMQNIKKDGTLSKVEISFAFRYASCIQDAYSRGRCYVKWAKLLALPSRTIFEFLELYYNNFIKNGMKDIVNKWDKIFKEETNEK